MVGRRHPDHADVAEEVPADDLRLDALAVGELDVDRARGADRCRRAGLELGDVRDDVRVREDRAGPVDHEAGALRRAVRAEVRIDGDDAVRAGRVERCRIERPGGRRRPDGGVGRRRRRGGLHDRGGRAPEIRGRHDEDRRAGPDRGGECSDGNCDGRPHRATVAAALPTARARVSTWKPGARTHFHVETASSADRDGGGRERERERRPPRRAAQLDRALHVGRELARDRKTEPAARRLGAVDPVEAIEDALCVLGRDPGTVVVDGEDDPAAGSRRRDDDLGARRGVGERVRDQRTADLEHPLLVGDRPGLGVGLDRHRVTGRLRERRDLVGEQPCHVRERHLLALHPQSARVHAREVEQVGRELREPLHLLARRGEEPRAGLLVEVLVRHQLEEAGKREQRRAELVRRVCDELLACGVQLRELDAHALERCSELAELVSAEVDDGLVELALRDAVGRALEAPDAPRVERRRGASEDRGDRERDARGVQQPPLHDAHGGELVLDRGREKQDVSREEGHRDLGERPAAPLDPAARRPSTSARSRGRRCRC